MRKLRLALSTILVLISLGAAEARAANSANVCNRSTTGAWIAFGYYAGDTLKWVTTGWWWAEPNECTGRVPLLADVDDVYVYANSEGDDVEWQGTKPLCVSTDAFETVDAENADCDRKVPFKKYGKDPDGNLDPLLQDDGATRVGYQLTLCNGTEDTASVVLGNVPADSGGISTDGWFPIEAGKCETFVRRGKSDQAYFFAQTPARRLVWPGDAPLCTRYHRGFAMAAADSGACADGDSERLPFVKLPLSGGRGSYELTAEKAKSFKYALNFCNGYGSDVYAAIAHLDSIWPNGNVARGYWRLHPGECKLVDVAGGSPAYVYGETAKREKVWSGNDLTGCVRDDAFTIPGVDRRACNGSGERKAGFLKWSVSEGPNVYKFE